jgi:hypothetical protein
MIGARKKTSVTYKKGQTQYPKNHSSGHEKLTVTDHDKKPISDHEFCDKGFFPLFLELMSLGSTL